MKDALILLALVLLPTTIFPLGVFLFVRWLDFLARLVGLSL